MAAGDARCVGASVGKPTAADADGSLFLGADGFGSGMRAVRVFGSMDGSRCCGNLWRRLYVGRWVFFCLFKGRWGGCHGDAGWVSKITVRPAT
jgi:hypothetical protein